MIRSVLITVCLLCLLPPPAFAHRLDEYLQATILSVDAGRIEASMRLIPGVAVSPVVLASVDTNGDGAFTDAEQQAYAHRVLNDLILKVDNQALALHLVFVSFPSVDEIKQGLGVIQLKFTADLPKGGANRTLIFENHHQERISVYLVNCLVPRDRNTRITQQTRNENQSFYQLDFTQAAAATQSSTLPTFSGFAGAFRLGVRHIAEGTDHLLFLLTLLLPAPLLACAGRWDRRASIGRSLMQILRIVTAFTVGHSLTLALSAFGLLHLPGRPVEVLIAVSILISALHAIRPLFPGREDAIAAFFGLIHGAAFASALSDLGFGQWYRLVSILGFNLGIEAMQLAVVAATLPSLLLLSRTQSYSAFRNAGAILAAVASLSWIMERALVVPNPVGPLIERSALYAPWIATLLLVFSLFSWIFSGNKVSRSLPRAS
jgi:HupE / UreJ protein